MEAKNHIFLHIYLALLVLLFTWAVFFAPWLFAWLTYEDLPGEWAQWYGFLFAAVYAFRLARLPEKNEHNFFYFFLFASLLYVVLEEISWGQRLLGFSSPELFQKYNIQGETNLHNFFTGPIGTPLKKGLAFVLSLGMLLYGLSELYWDTLLARLSSFASHISAKTEGEGGSLMAAALASPFVSFVSFVKKAGFEAPPLVLAPWFVLAAFFELGLFSFNEAELAELFVALGLAFQMALLWDQSLEERQNRRNTKRKKHVLQKNASPSFFSHLLFVMILVPALSLATSFALMQLDYFARPTKNRLNNGYIKFAKRYLRYDAYEISLSLYRRALQNGKKTSKVYFGIADTLDALGRYEDSEKWLRQYAEHLKEWAEKKPNNPRPFFLLSEVYDRLIEDGLSELYHRQAYRLVEKRLKREPRNAALYFLKGSLLLREDKESEAARMFEKAYRLKPGRLLYRKKYFYYKEFLE